MDNTLNKYLQNFITTTKQSASTATAKNYQYYINRFLEWGHIYQPEKITKNKIEEFRLFLQSTRNSRGELLKPSTRNYHLIAIRSFLNYLADNNIKIISADEISLNKLSSKKHSAISKSDLEKLLNSPLNTKEAGVIQKRDKAILELILSTGLKVNEVSYLNKKQINFINGQVLIQKNEGRPRLVPINNQTKYWIKKYIETRHDNIPALFIRHDKAKKTQLNKIKLANYHLTPRTIQRIVKKYTKHCGLDPQITPEKIRQAYASILIEEGYKISEVQSMLGHTSLATTKLLAKQM